MKLSLAQLNTQLKQKKLAPLYLISSDDPLQMQDASSAIIRTAKELEFTQRCALHYSKGFNWQDFTQETGNLSLFGDKKIIEFHNPKSSVNKELVQHLVDFIEQANDDTLVIAKFGKLTKAQLSGKTLAPLLAQCAFVQLWPISAQELPRWLRDRAKAMQLNLNAEAAELIAHMTEGNLLASQQALEKLKILHGDAPISLQAASASVSDNARYSIFDWTNAMIAGNVAQTNNIYTHLNEEGSEPTLLLWSIVNELRAIAKLQQRHQAGESFDQVLRSVWQSKRAGYQTALRRLSPRLINECLYFAQYIDTLIKGIQVGDARLQLSRLGLSVARAQRLFRMSECQSQS